MLHAFLDDDQAGAEDALRYADPLPEEGSDDVLAHLGFNAGTGTDVALRHEGMLAYGLQLQEDYENGESY